MLSDCNCGKGKVNKVVSVGWGDDVSPNYLNTIDKKIFMQLL
jgi:hypothetical protein